MFRSILFISVTILLLGAEVIKNEELSGEEFKAQNRQIAELAAGEMNKNTPQQVDSYTTLASVRSSGTTIIYNYELDVDGKSDDELREDASKKMAQGIIDGSCASSRRFLEADIDLHYIYTSKKSKSLLFEVKVTKRSCKS
ncbi:MAG: hypothetical protein WCR69_04910 [Sulfuricurvum sp.]